MARGKSKDIIVSFNSGELSPKMDARIDIEKYKSGCKQLQNAVVEIYGAAVKRPGFQYIQPAKYDDTPSRLVDFRYSATTSFMIEMGDNYVRFYSNGVQVAAPSGIKTAWLTATGYTKGQYVTQASNTYLCEIAHTSGTFATDLAAGRWIQTTAYEVQTVYDADDVFAVQFTQANDVVYLTHPDYPVQKLTRVADDSWTIATPVFDVPAMLDENFTTTTITPSATTGTITLTASAALFNTLHAGTYGSYWRIGYQRAAQSLELTLGSTGTSSSIKVSKGLAWNVYSYGTWSATFNLERSDDGGTTWVPVRRYIGASDRNIAQAGVEEDGNALYRLNCTAHTSGTGYARFEVPDAYVYGTVKVTGFTSSTVVTATVIDTLESTAATDIWAEGAWSSFRGFPRAATLHNQRLMFGGTDYEKQKVWGSKIGDFENIEYGTLDDDAVAYVLGAKQTNVIQWLSSGNALEIGTAGEEWITTGQDGFSSITPSSVFARRQSSVGSAAIQAILTKDTTVFVQRAGTRLHEMTYTQDRNQYLSSELTVYADHITEGGVVQMAYQQQNQSVIWAVTGDGILIGLTYERDQGVIGWHRHVTDGFFESVSTIPGDGPDEVWCVVRRTIDGETKRYIERMNPVQWEDKEDCFYVDSGLSYDGAPASVFSGLEHLEGKEVSILADGAVVPNQTVTGGQITLPDGLEASMVHIGLPYEVVIQPMKLDVDAMIGPTQGQVKIVYELNVRLFKTLGLEYGNGTSRYSLPFRSTSMDMDSSPPLYTGDKKLEFAGDYGTDGPVIIYHHQPLPLTLLGLVIKYNVTGE